MEDIDSWLEDSSRLLNESQPLSYLQSDMQSQVKNNSVDPTSLGFMDETGENAHKIILYNSS